VARVFRIITVGVTLAASAAVARAQAPTTASAPAEIRHGAAREGPPGERSRRFYESVIRTVQPDGVGVPERLPHYLALFRREFVEDPRQFAIDVRATTDDTGRVVLTGHLEYAEHRRALATFLGHLGFRDLDDRIELLPAGSLGEAPVAIVSAERAFLYGAPRPPRETLSEVVRGEPVFLLRDAGSGTFLAHAADGYVGYLDAAAVERVDAEAFVRRTAPAGTRPDERVEQVIVAAERHLGVPYVWGGRSGAGIDCSGLVQVAHQSTGVNLPRDAGQQSLGGRLVATRAFRAPLRRGDVLFFLGRRGTVSHTAIYLGDDRFIEATEPGVKVSSFNPGHPEYSRRRDEGFCFAKRMIE
jgi:hypothetical protein